MSGTVIIDRRHFLANCAITLACAQFDLTGCASAQSGVPTRLSEEGSFPSLSGAVEWINSRTLTPTALRGKVVLVDFWTYTCVNWRRTLPYLRAWAEKYRDHGLVVLGVHTPEFSFEHNLDNVRWAIQDMRIDYPVAVDNNYAIWNAFNNEYWPALYFIDAKGHIRHHQFGEGGYQQSEAILQRLLVEAGNGNIGQDLVLVEPRGAEVPADGPNLRTPETYTGYGQTENFSSHGGVVWDKPHVYALPSRLDLNHWALAGDWTVNKEPVTLNQSPGRVGFRFHARDVNLVMGPATRGSAGRFRVLIDGQPPAAAHGTDSDASGNGTVIEQRLYQLIRQVHPIADRQFEIEFLDPGVEVFDFTFG